MAGRLMHNGSRTRKRSHVLAVRHAPAQSGQIGVIILLLMVVMLTIGISFLSRSTRELRVATQESESSRVLSAAESGIESALNSNLSTLSYTSDVATIASAPHRLPH
jgi:Tfp pilus assembly protein PilX